MGGHQYPSRSPKPTDIDEHLKPSIRPYHQEWRLVHLFYISRGAAVIQCGGCIDTLTPRLEHSSGELNLRPMLWYHVQVHRVLPKDWTPSDTASHKQITDQHTDVCHVVKTLKREIVHDPSQIATWSNLLCKRKKVTWDFHNRSTRQGPSMLFK